MGFGNRVVIAVSLEETTHAHLATLRDLKFLNEAEVHFVHVFQTTNMGYGLGEYALVYPPEPDRKALEKSLIEALKKSCCDCFPKGKVVYKCLFDQSPKEEFCLYAKEVEADTIIVFTREKRGFFESSFAQFVSRHSPCHTLILKP